MRPALLIVAIVGCRGSGVDIDILPPNNVALDSVQLWVGSEPCDNCPNGVSWGPSPRLDGDIYLLRDEEVIQAAPLDDRFVIHLEATSENTDPIAIAVVGFDANQGVKAIKVLRGVHIPGDHGVMWIVKMHAAQEASTDEPMPTLAADDIYRGHVWRPKPTQTVQHPIGCLAYQKWNALAMPPQWENEYFVPKSDRDCDGQPETLECSDYWFNYSPQGSCVVPDPVVNNACRVGFNPCADGVTGSNICGPDKVSTPLLTCVPDQFCQTCSSMLPADTCVAQAIADGMMGSMPYFECGFPMIADTTVCMFYARITLPQLASRCTTALLHYADQPFTNPTGTLVYNVNGVETKLESRFVTTPTNDCYVDLIWRTGTYASLGTGIPLLVEVTYLNGNSIEFPVFIKPEPTPLTCMTTFEGACEPNGSVDASYSCGNAL